MAKEILIADPDGTDQEELKKIFDRAGYHLIFSEDGEDALFRIRLFKPDLVIAAMTLGEKTGLELCETLKRNPQFKDIPFVLLTEIFEDISEEDRRRVQMDGILSKPLERNEIFDLVDGLLLKGETGVKEEVYAEGEEEIIELVDVVEEPEAKMSIDDWIAVDREISSLGLAEKVAEEVPPEEERIFFPEETEVKEEGPKYQPKPETPPENQLLEELELEEVLPKIKKPPESLRSLEEFEAELKAPVRAEAPEVELKEFLFGEPKDRGPTEVPPREMTLEEELTLFEESFEKPKKHPAIEAASPENMGWAKIEEELALFEKPFEAPKELPEMQAALAEKMVETGIREEGILFEEPLETLKGEPEAEMPPLEKTAEIGIQEEALSELSAEEFPEALLEEALKEEEIGFLEMPKEKEIGTIGGAESQVVSKEAISPLVRVVDRKIEDVITKGLQDMMEDFITKVVPEMAQNVIALTVERIEKMVKEMVPELTEKAIQEEIKRLQRGEKD